RSAIAEHIPEVWPPLTRKIGKTFFEGGAKFHRSRVIAFRQYLQRQDVLRSGSSLAYDLGIFPASGGIRSHDLGFEAELLRLPGDDGGRIRIAIDNQHVRGRLNRTRNLRGKIGVRNIEDLVADQRHLPLGKPGDDGFTAALSILIGLADKGDLLGTETVDDIVGDRRALLA